MNILGFYMMFSNIILKMKFKRASRYIESGDYAKAYELYKKLVEKNYEILFSTYCLGWICYEKQEYEQALNFFDKVLNIDPNYYNALVYKGMVFYETGQYHDSLNSMIMLLKKIKKIMNYYIIKHWY